MKRIKKIIGLIAFLAIAAITIITLKHNKGIAAKKIFTYDKSKPINVITEKVQSTSLNSEDLYSGTFQPVKEVKVSADIQGKITKVLVENGELVEEGQPLLKIDQSMIVLKRDAINTKINGLEKDIKRYKSLVEADAIQGVKLEKALLGLETAKVEMATIQEQLNKTTVIAPFDGVITAKLTEKGAFAAPGIPLFQLSDIEQLKFTVFVSENKIMDFHFNDTLQITVDAKPGEKISGAVTMIGCKANKAMNFPVEITVDNESVQLKAGMFGYVSTDDSGNVDQGILIPLSSVMGESDSSMVYLVESGKAKLQKIQLNGAIGRKAIVKNGLSPNDEIVVEGMTNLFDGANVITK